MGIYIASAFIIAALVATTIVCIERLLRRK